MVQGHEKSGNNQSGKEKRAYPRYAGEIQGQLIEPSQGKRTVTIKDYCIGGMYLELIDSALLGEPVWSYIIKVGDVLNIVISLQSADLNKQLSFKIKVMRVQKDYVGVSFLKPNLSAIQSLHKYVIAKRKQATNVEENFGTTQTVFNGKSSAQVLSEAHQLVANELESLMEKFNNNISKQFFKAAKETFDLAKKNTLFESLGVIKSNRHKITNSFITSYEDKIKNYSPKDILHEDKNEEEKEISHETLSLVETDVLDDWLSLSSIITNIDADNRDELGHVERRTSALYQEKINNKNNPFGPAIFAYAFKDAINDIDVTHDVKLICYTSFREAYLSIAEKLYKDLNKFFISNDVLPVLKFKVEHSGSSASQEVNKISSDAKDEVSENYNSEPAGGTTAPAQILPAENLGTILDGKNYLASQGRELVNLMHQQQPTISTDHKGLLNLISNIRNLQKNLKQIQSGEPGEQLSSLSPLSNDDATQLYTPLDLLNALSNKQFSGYDFSAQTDIDQSDLKKKIQHILSTKGGGLENKQISSHEEQVIDVASNVFNSLMSDLKVSESIRPWIKQLEIPVLKMTIVDNSVLTDPSHVVRQVINKISELEVLADADDIKEQKAIKQAFDWSIEIINKHFDGTTKVFERIAEQLDILIKLQKQTFDKNLKVVVDEFLTEDKTAKDDDVVIDVEDEWARRVNRLEEGDWVLFDAYSETPVRLKVGWVAKRKGKYVFVNVLGKKEKVLKLDELIELFKEGDTIALDSAEDPAMDRAQYSMLQKLHKQLLFQSSHDQLTGLMNRREFEVNVEKAIDDAKISNNKHALCYIDMDKFNVINDSCGYEGGDTLIKEVSEMMKKHMTENSALARLGGDEFCMLLYGHGTDDALDILEGILAELNKYRFVWEDKRLSVAMSIGLVLIEGHGQTVTKLLQDAEASCSVAKEIGGHRVQLYHEDHARLGKRGAEIKWAAKIDKALDEDALHLRCQRIMPLAIEDSYHDHYEILLGMTDDLGEQSSLQEFINAAENYKRMSEIDRWVIKKSFSWIAENRAQLDHVSSFSINLSGHSLNDLGLMEYVMKQMRDTNVPIGKICFEITETLGIANLSDASDFIKRFKITGCYFSLDDFGSGMSSYGYLKSLPVDYLKIDGTFVKEMATNPNDYAVVKSITEIGHFMGKKIIAEYVQDDETIQLLQDLGVDYAQGYGIEKPSRLDDILI